MKRAYADARASGDPASGRAAVARLRLSYDQFRDYEDRGDKFKAFVAKLSQMNRRRRPAPRVGPVQLPSLCRAARRARHAKSPARPRLKRAVNAIAERAAALLDRVRTYDRALIVIALILLVLGILFSMAASPVRDRAHSHGGGVYFAARQAAVRTLAVGVIVRCRSVRTPPGAALFLDPRRDHAAALRHRRFDCAGG